MKKIFAPSLMLSLLFVACNNSAKDSVEKADSANEAKADSSTGNDTTNRNSNTDGVLNTTESAADFMVAVADVGLTEVTLGQLAESKASNKRVKAFARMMVMDHTKANAELKSLAKQKNVTLPTKPGDDHQKKIDELKGKSGADFDKAYMDAMEDGHESTVNRFERNQNTSDSTLRTFVNKTLPTLRVHLDSARAIRQGLGQ